MSKVKASAQSASAKKAKVQSEKMEEYEHGQRLLGYCIEATSKATQALDNNGLRSVNEAYLRTLKLESVLTKIESLAQQVSDLSDSLTAMKEDRERDMEVVA